MGHFTSISVSNSATSINPDDMRGCPRIPRMVSFEAIWSDYRTMFFELLFDDKSVRRYKFKNESLQAQFYQDHIVERKPVIMDGRFLRRNCIEI